MPERGDIVLAHAALDEMDRYIVKRVIAVAGENITIDYSSNVIYVNGKEIPEPYICYTQTDPMKPRNGTSLVEYLVPADSFFVLGDNRNFSTDILITCLSSCKHLSSNSSAAPAEVASVNAGENETTHNLTDKAEIFPTIREETLAYENTEDEPMRLIAF